MGGVDMATDANVRAVVTSLVTSIPAGPFLITLIRRTKHRFALSPPFGWVRFGSFNCTQPISNEFGLDKGSLSIVFILKTFWRRVRQTLRAAYLSSETVLTHENSVAIRLRRATFGT